MHDQDRRRPALPARLAPAEREFFMELRRLLDAAGLSARDLASARADAATWQGWINGESIPPPQAVTDLASRLARNGTGAGRLTRLRSRITVPTSYPAAAVRSAATPRQLPAETGSFTGRADDLKILERLARQAAGVSEPVVASAGSVPAGDGPTVIVLAGPAGVGKTALAVHAAHRLSDLFPAGQLWAGLRGSAGAGDPVPDGQALRGFLEALGVAPGDLPKDTDGQAALYRSRLAGRQALIVLDDARDASQIRRLIPAGRGCLVLVTTRASAFNMPNAPVHLLRVGPLREWEAHNLLEQRLSAERIRSEPAAAADLVRLCGRLPLPLGVAAAWASAEPDLPLTELAAALRSDDGGTGDAEGGPEGGPADPVTTARRILTASYTRLSDNARQMFRLLSLCPGPDISVPAAASLAAIPPGQAGGALDEIAARYLIEEHRPGRFIVHGLLREFAAGQDRANEGDSGLDAARRRLLDHYLRSMHAAMCMLYPERRAIRLVPPVPGVTPEILSHAQSLEWWQAERLVVRSLVTYAAGHRDLFGYCWQLAWAMAPLLLRGGFFHDYLATQETAIAAAEGLEDPLGQGIAHYEYAHACALLGETGDSGAHLRQALDWFAKAGDQVGAAASLDGLAQLLMQEGDYPQALERAKEALEIRRVIGLPDGIAHSEHTLGMICARLGRHDEAARHCQRSLDLSRETGSRAHTADALSTLGSVHLSLGAYDRAVACYMEVLAICRLIGDSVQTAQALTGLGDAQHAKGNGRAAGDAWRQALSILSDLPNADIAPLQARLDGIPR